MRNRLRGGLGLVAGQPEINQVPLPGGPNAVGHEKQAALAPRGPLHPETDGIEEEILVLIAQRAVVEGRRGLI